MKIPRQIHHWAYKAGLRRYRGITRPKFYYWKGHGRCYRINMYNKLDISEPYETFDRWANSTSYTFDLPTSEKEFRKIIYDHLHGTN